jgi:hypothetical protein
MRTRTLRCKCKALLAKRLEKRKRAVPVHLRVKSLKRLKLRMSGWTVSLMKRKKNVVLDK